MDTACKNKNEEKRAIVIGAGEAGYITVRTLLREGLHVICIIDDDISKLGTYILGVKVLGSRKDIGRIAAESCANEIIFAIPSLSDEETRAFYDICKDVPRCELKKVPALLDFVEDRFQLSDIRNVQIEDLLGRSEIKIDTEGIKTYFSGKTVLITGGGGSVGSELCRQIAGFSPKKIVIFDIYENRAYELQQELRGKYGDTGPDVMIGSVRDTKRLDSLFGKYRPDIVFHAAAHKHVPLMEACPCEAVKNNVFGTYNAANAAIKYNAEKFILISTDKAVNPTSVMGATKQICEELLMSLSRKQCGTEFVAVRFGNVFDSNGSVIPLFRSQIERGGPVTVTHSGITRYFMTIPEAVSLVLQSALYARGGEIFVLDMGKPVRIDALAKNMIRLAGFVPDADIKIEYTGLRPGEKLYEEPLVCPSGCLEKTENKLIFIEKQQKFGGDIDELLNTLNRLACGEDDSKIKKFLDESLPTYHPSK